MLPVQRQRSSASRKAISDARAAAIARFRAAEGPRPSPRSRRTRPLPGQLRRQGDGAVLASSVTGNKEMVTPETGRLIPPRWRRGCAGWPGSRRKSAAASALPGGRGCSTASPWTGWRSAWARSSPAAGGAERRLRARWAALPEGLRATILYAGATGWTKGIGLLLPLITGLLPAPRLPRRAPA